MRYSNINNKIKSIRYKNTLNDDEIFILVLEKDFYCFTLENSFAFRCNFRSLRPIKAYD